MRSICVLVSGAGTTLQAVIDAIGSGKLDARISKVIADRKCMAIDRATKAGISTVVVKRGNDFQSELMREMESSDADFFLLAGFLSILEPAIIQRFRNRIINTHPSLLPCFGGKGFYGMKVHEAVIKSGSKFSGCTVHFVTEEIDGGPIILQRAIQVDDVDTPETLENKIHAIEHSAVLQALNIVISGRYRIDGKRVIAP
ncbi:phosphoribosylglycinamide formyltransferase [Thermoplasma sp.]|uniref:phosphoribosylglycinamide formyltransferase n=1 Tax=Thermoplasma sp. TaxID=1973142 RepID=UPI00127F03D0|nr:phosphoribosylglycinamide formyltransferase [Thermoplasma sp.]KAA8922340.1 MAG: phosphoribosylglycinamide formyltransferase [Thermoplasma sp.]